MHNNEPPRERPANAITAPPPLRALFSEIQQRLKHQGWVRASRYLLSAFFRSLPSLTIVIIVHRDLRQPLAIGIPPPHLYWQPLEEHDLPLVKNSFGPLTEAQFRRRLRQHHLGMIAIENGIVEHYAWISTTSELLPLSENQCYLYDFYTSPRCNDPASAIALRFKQLAVARQAGAHTAITTIPLLQGLTNKKQRQLLGFRPAALLVVLKFAHHVYRHSVIRL